MKHIFCLVVIRESEKRFAYVHPLEVGKHNDLQDSRIEVFIPMRSKRVAADLADKMNKGYKEAGINLH